MLGAKGWQEVPVNAVSGSVIKDDGTCDDPAVPEPVPEVPSKTEGRSLTWDEFLDVGMATDAAKTNTILVKMPVVAEYGRKYVTTAGIEFADAATPGTRLANLMAAAKAAGLIDDAFLQAFMANWVRLYPLMVPQT